MDHFEGATYVLFVIDNQHRAFAGLAQWTFSSDHFLLHEIRQRNERGERVLVTTLTKRMSEKLADYLMELGMRVHYLHSEVHTIERTEILRDLRMGVFDVVVGINLLREGLDLP